MTIWLDAQLPPSAAAWIQATFGVECRAVRDLGLRDAKDPQIFQAARDARVETSAVVSYSGFPGIPCLEGRGGVRWPNGEKTL